MNSAERTGVNERAIPHLYVVIHVYLVSRFCVEIERQISITLIEITNPNFEAK
jgi:hypothetical protein